MEIESRNVRFQVEKRSLNRASDLRYRNTYNTYTNISLPPQTVRRSGLPYNDETFMIGEEEEKEEVNRIGEEKREGKGRGSVEAHA